ncbi:hypothetical protein ACCT28_17260 [Rhizobium ruizarguesonis]
MSPATLLIAPQVRTVRPETVSLVVKRMRSLFSAIEERGHIAAMLAPEITWPCLAQSVELARLFEKEAPRHVRWVETITERDAYFVLWPKDGFCDWGSFIAAADTPGFSAFAGTFGSPVRVDPALSEGGMFARVANTVLVSSAVQDQVALPTDLRVIRLPHPYSSDLYRRHQPEHQPLTHLDLDVALVPCAGSTLLIVSKRYLESYRGSITSAAECLGLELVEVSQDEANKRGLNLVALSERAVLVPAGCPQLSGLLADRLGSESVIQVQIDDIFNYNGGRGGLGCMSNVVRGAAMPVIT